MTQTLRFEDTGQHTNTFAMCLHSKGRLSQSMPAQRVLYATYPNARQPAVSEHFNMHSD